MGTITTAIASAFRDYLTENLPASGAHEPVKSDIRALGPIIEAAFATSLGAVTVAKTTKSLLDADLAHAAGTTAIVYADSTDANNDLYLKSGSSGSGSWTNTGLLHQTAEGLIAPYLAELREGNFFSTFDDAYIRAIVKWIRIEGGPPGRIYVLNVLSDTAGSNRRLSFFLYDTVRGANVAIWNRQKAYNWASEVPDVVSLTGAANGSVRGDVDYVGLTCSIGLDTSAISFTHNLTSYTDPEDGILPQNVWTPQEVQRRIRTGEGLFNHVITVGPGGDFSGVGATRAAVDSLLKLDGTDPEDIQRGWFPYSDVCTVANQYTIRYLPGHPVEDIAIRAAGNPGEEIGVGVLCWPGLTFEFAADTHLRTDGTHAGPSGTDGPLFDVNYGGRFILASGTVLENTSNEGDVFHLDSGNALTVVSEANASDPTAGLFYFRTLFFLRGGRLKGKKRVIANGTAQGGTITLEDTILEETAVSGNLAPFVAHDSAGSTVPARFEFRNVTFIHPGGGPSIDLIKQNARTTRDEVMVDNCDASQVQITNTVSGASPTPGYIRCGRIDVAVVSPELDP